MLRFLNYQFSISNMIIIPAEEFNRQARSSSGFFGKVYHQKKFIPGVIFSIGRKDAALSYCRNWMNENPSFLCILVEDTHQLQVWYEQLNQKTSVRDVKDSTKKKSSLLKSRHLQIDTKFVAQCQQILIDAIGLIAKIVVKKVISQNPRSNREQFIADLLKELPKSQQEEVERQLKQLLRES